MNWIGLTFRYGADFGNRTADTYVHMYIRTIDQRTADAYHHQYIKTIPTAVLVVSLVALAKYGALLPLPA